MIIIVFLYLEINDYFPFLKKLLSSFLNKVFHLTFFSSQLFVSVSFLSCFPSFFSRFSHSSLFSLIAFSHLSFASASVGVDPYFQNPTLTTLHSWKLSHSQSPVQNQTSLIDLPHQTIHHQNPFLHPNTLYI